MGLLSKTKGKQLANVNRQNFSFESSINHTLCFNCADFSTRRHNINV